jgi:hypothetical protein
MKAVAVLVAGIFALPVTDAAMLVAPFRQAGVYIMAVQR